MPVEGEARKKHVTPHPPEFWKSLELEAWQAPEDGVRGGTKRNKIHWISYVTYVSEKNSLVLEDKCVEW